MRSCWILLAATLTAAGAQAHFVFVYVEKEAEARLVFGHAAKPDEKTPSTRAEKTRLHARDADGKDTSLTIAKGDGNFYAAQLPAKGTIVVHGTTDAGVTQRGEMPPMLSWYYPKTILGDPFTPAATLGKTVPLEIVPVRDGKGVRFQVLSEGKPAPEMEVVVGLSEGGEESSETVKTDAEGRTRTFDQTGRYCVAVRKSIDKPGERDGKTYSAIRHIATLVIDLPSPGGK